MNWIQKIRNHTGKLPRYGCITYDFDDNPFSDAAWNAGVKKLWDRSGSMRPVDSSGTGTRNPGITP